MTKAEMTLILQRRLEITLALAPEIAAQVSQFLISNDTVTYETLFYQPTSEQDKRSGGQG